MTHGASDAGFSASHDTTSHVHVHHDTSSSSHHHGHHSHDVHHDPRRDDHHDNHHHKHHHHHPHRPDHGYPVEALPPPYVYGTLPTSTPAPMNSNRRFHHHHHTSSFGIDGACAFLFKALFTTIVIGIFIRVMYGIATFPGDHMALLKPHLNPPPFPTHPPLHPPSHPPSAPPLQFGNGDDNDDVQTPNGRRFTRHETFSSITGHFDLYDYLELTTVTGTIDVAITPQPGSGPAVLKLRSATGAITVRLSDEYLVRARALDLETVAHDNDIEDDGKTNIRSSLKRPFDTEIVSATGSIDATLLIGNGGKTEISSRTGSLTLNLLVVNAGPTKEADDSSTTGGITRLETNSQTGAQSIRVDPLSRFGGGKITTLKGEHVSLSTGTMDVHYPLEWEGKVEAVVIGTGTLDVQGQGLEIDAQTGHYVKAHRGDGGVGVELTGRGTGALTFRC